MALELTEEVTLSNVLSFCNREVIDVNQDKLGKMGRRVSQVSFTMESGSYGFYV